MQSTSPAFASTVTAASSTAVAASTTTTTPSTSAIVNTSENQKSQLKGGTRIKSPLTSPGRNTSSLLPHNQQQQQRKEKMLPHQHRSVEEQTLKKFDLNPTSITNALNAIMISPSTTNSSTSKKSIPSHTATSSKTEFTLSDIQNTPKTPCKSSQQLAQSSQSSLKVSLSDLLLRPHQFLRKQQPVLRAGRETHNSNSHEHHTHSSQLQVTLNSKSKFEEQHSTLNNNMTYLNCQDFLETPKPPQTTAESSLKQIIEVAFKSRNACSPAFKQQAQIAASLKKAAPLNQSSSHSDIIIVPQLSSKINNNNQYEPLIPTSESDKQQQSHSAKSQINILNKINLSKILSSPLVPNNNKQSLKQSKQSTSLEKQSQSQILISSSTSIIEEANKSAANYNHNHQLRRRNEVTGCLRNQRTKTNQSEISALNMSVKSNNSNTSILNQQHFTTGTGSTAAQQHQPKNQLNSSNNNKNLTTDSGRKCPSMTTTINQKVNPQITINEDDEFDLMCTESFASVNQQLTNLSQSPSIPKNSHNDNNNNTIVSINSFPSCVNESILRTQSVSQLQQQNKQGTNANILSFAQSLRESLETRKDTSQFSVDSINPMITISATEGIKNDKIEFLSNQQSNQQKYRFNLPNCTNHPSKRGKYRRTSVPQNEWLCSKCAIDCAGRGTKVEQPSNLQIKQQVISDFTAYLTTEVNQELNTCLSQLNISEKQLSNLTENRTQSIHDFYEQCRVILEKCKEEDLLQEEQLFRANISALNSNRNLIFSHLIDVENISKDIDENREQIYTSIEAGPFYAIINQYEQKCQEFIAYAKTTTLFPNSTTSSTPSSYLRFNPRIDEEQLVGNIIAQINAMREEFFTFKSSFEENAFASACFAGEAEETPVKQKEGNSNKKIQQQQQLPQAIDRSSANQLYVSFDNREMFAAVTGIGIPPTRVSDSIKCESHSAFLSSSNSKKQTMKEIGENVLTQNNNNHPNNGAPFKHFPNETPSKSRNTAISNHKKNVQSLPESILSLERNFLTQAGSNVQSPGMQNRQFHAQIQSSLFSKTEMGICKTEEDLSTEVFSSERQTHQDSPDKIEGKSLQRFLSAFSISHKSDSKDKSFLFSPSLPPSL